MITKTLHRCSYSELWVSPANWQKATKKDLEKDWYVQIHKEGVYSKLHYARIYTHYFLTIYFIIQKIFIPLP